MFRKRDDKDQLTTKLTSNKSVLLHLMLPLTFFSSRSPSLNDDVSINVQQQT